MSSEKPRVVFDCMIFLQAAARHQGIAAACLRLAEQRYLSLFISPAILREVQDVLSRDYIRARFETLTDETVAAFIDRLRNIGQLVKRVPKKFDYQERDVKDEPYINLAIQVEADYLVSRDKDLLDLMKWDKEISREFQRRFKFIKVVTPETFIQEIKE